MESTGAARTASSAMTEWIERDAIAYFEIRDPRADLDHFTGRFVSEDNGQARDHPLCPEFPIYYVQVGAAHAACTDTNEDRGVARRWHRCVDQFGAGSRTGFRNRLYFRTSDYLQYDGATVRVKENMREGLARARESLFPVAQRGAAITHARANEAIVGVLLERMRDPSRGAADRENCGRHRARKSDHASAYGQVEVQIRA
jgi:hypothetical protein